MQVNLDQANADYSVIYSFSGRWEAALRDGAVRVFFRKRRPKKLPNTVFFYLGVPVKKIIGHARVEKIESVSLKNALRIKEEGAISENELKKYIGTSDSVHAIWISEPTLYKSPFELAELKEKFGFHPPQSFSNLQGELATVLAGKNL